MLLQGCVLWVTVVFGLKIMATLGQVNEALAAQTQAIRDLEGRIPPPAPPPAATEADLDGVKATIEANTGAINAILPPTATAAATKTTEPKAPEPPPQKKRW